MVDLLQSQSELKTQNFAVVCAWCHRQRVMGPDLNLYWIEIDDGQREENVTHTICPTCKTKITGQLNVKC